MEGLTSKEKKAIYMKKYRRSAINQFKQKQYEVNYWKRQCNALKRELEKIKEA